MKKALEVLRANGYICDERHLFCYNPITGSFIRLAKIRKVITRVKYGKTVTNGGNTTIDGKGTTQLTHVMWWLATGNWPNKGQIVDHKDRDVYNSKLDNLRLTDNEGNSRNRTPTPRMVNGIKAEPGVYAVKARVNQLNKYVAQVSGMTCGYYPTVEDANAAARKYRKIIHGEMAFDVDRITRRRIT